MLQVIRPDRGVEFRIAQARPGKVFHAHSLRDPLRRRAHHLHQPGRPGGGFCTRDETALLAHQAEHPGLVQIARARFLGEHFAIRRQVAHGKIVGENGPVRGADGAIPGFVAARELRRGQEPPVVHAADGPQPLLRRLGPHVHAIERERPLQARNRRDPGDLVFGGRRGPGRNLQAHPELLGGEAAVKMGLSSNAFEVALRFERAAELALGPAVPVDPDWIVLRDGRHALDRASDLGPLLGPERDSRAPGELLVGECSLCRLAEPV